MFFLRSQQVRSVLNMWPALPRCRRDPVDAEHASVRVRYAVVAFLRDHGRRGTWCSSSTPDLNIFPQGIIQGFANALVYPLIVSVLTYSCYHSFSLCLL